MQVIQKYPRTPHIEGSRLQPGDEDLEQVPLAMLAGRHVVVEEKVDGANCAISFSPEGRLLLQSRGHYLTGGPRERQFHMFKSWATSLQMELHAVLGSRFILYGEWLYAKHTVFYNALPHYFLEFDVLDRESGEFLDTPRRRALLMGLPVSSVPVLHAGRMIDVREWLGPSHFRTEDWREDLAAACAAAGVDFQRALSETDTASEMEGVYLKVEQDGVVAGRYKYVRASFLTAVAASGSHWMNRPIVANKLAPGARVFA